MFELIGRIAELDPQRRAILTHEETVSYGALAESARGVAAALRDRGISRFAVADHRASTVVALLAGASLAGAEACLYPPEDAQGITALLERFDHDVLVTADPDLPGTIHPVELTGSGDLEVPVERPHLILTTGTTGVPKGVRHDWSRLLVGTDRVKAGDGERWLLAYGVHQFAGLQVLLHVFAAGATLVAPAPRRPREGLAAMRALDVTHASATPTYWRFLLAELRSDGGPVPPLTQVTLGGEAIPGPLLDDVRRAFPAANVSQVYAASEFGSTGSVRDGRAGLSTDVLDRGDDADVAMRIVDGELWIRSRGGMLGYYGEPPVDADGWRPTGDLVEIVHDRILFRGRSSEIINVGGVKVHPLPIEERVGAVPGVDMARVYGRKNAVSGAIVAIEVVAAAGVDQKDLSASIRAACEDLPAAARPRSIRFVDAIATAGSKIVRRESQ